MTELVPNIAGQLFGVFKRTMPLRKTEKTHIVAIFTTERKSKYNQKNFFFTVQGPNNTMEPWFNCNSYTKLGETTNK